MVSKTLTKLIDEGVVPAILLILAKMGGLLFAVFFFHLSFTLKVGGVLKILPTLDFVNTQGYITAENYSNLAMFLTSSLGTTFVLIRAHFFHESHIHPQVQSKLHKLNLQNIIQPTYHLYHQAAIWLLFLWLTTAYLIVSAFLKITYVQITVIAFIVSANFSWLFAIDVEKEIEISQQK